MSEFRIESSDPHSSTFWKADFQNVDLILSNLVYTTSDSMRLLLVSSDPLIPHIRKEEKTNKRGLNEEAIALLKNLKETESDEENSESSDE